MQKRFDYVLGDSNKRQAKANDNYYLLLHVKEPIVIAECGFLSNREEAKKLETEEYQDRLDKFPDDYCHIPRELMTKYLQKAE